jgi:hypothetical protein
MDCCGYSHVFVQHPAMRRTEVTQLRALLVDLVDLFLIDT